MMLRGVATMLEKHHRVQLLDEAIEAAVKLSHRYIPARQLPDKAVSLLDTACARVAISQHATPPEVEDCQRRIEALETEFEIIGRESAIGIDVAARRGGVDEKLTAERARLATLHARWTDEKTLVDEMLDAARQAARRRPAGRCGCRTATPEAAPAGAPQAGSREARGCWPQAERRRSAARPCSPSCEICRTKLRDAAGRNAADPADGR